MSKIKLNLGCGEQILPGYINVDLYCDKADIKADVKKLPFDNDYADEVYSSPVIEHFDFKESWDVLEEWKRVLKPGGVLIIETPDMFGMCKRFVESDEQFRIELYGGFFACPWIPGQTHKFLYTETQLKWALDQLGFTNIERVVADSHYVLKETQDIFLKVIANKGE